MNDDELGEQVIGCALKVHKALGPGLLESVYETCLAHELGKAGLSFDRQLVLPVVYDGLHMESGFRVDLLVAARVVVEVKAVEQLNDVHRAQLLSYLKIGGFQLGYLLNFNVVLMKSGIVRLRNGYSREAR